MNKRADQTRINFAIENTELPKRNYKVSQQLHIFPFPIFSGFVNWAETGELSSGITDTGSFGDLRRVFTGRESVIARWEDASYSQNPVLTEYFKETDSVKKQALYNKLQDINTYNKDFYWEVKYQPGKFFLGYMENNEFSAEFQTRNEFAEQVIDKTIQIYTEDDYFIRKFGSRDTIRAKVDEYGFRHLFQIPEITEKSWLRIESITIFLDAQQKYHHTEITLTKMNNEIIQTGMSIDNFIHFNSPGGSFFYPKLTYDDKGVKQRAVEIDERYLEAPGFKYVQLDFNAPVALANVHLYGRPIYYKQEGSAISNDDTKNSGRFVLSRPLFIKDFYPSINFGINRAVSSINTHYGLFNCQLTLDTQWKSWRDEVNKRGDLTTKKTFEGFLNVFATDNKTKRDFSEVEKTNPTIPGLNKKYPIYANKKMKGYGKLSLSSSVLTDRKLTIGQEKIGSSNIVEKNTIDITNRDMTPADLLNYNFFALPILNSIPYGVLENITWRMTDIPLLGWPLNKILTFFGAGVNPTWNHQSTIYPSTSFNCLFPTSICDLVAKGYNTASVLGIPLDIFNDDKVSAFTSLIDVNSTMTSFTFDVSDMMTINNTQFNTADLVRGHRKIHDLNFTIDKTNSRYIADIINIQAIGKANVRISFFNELNEAPVWSGMWQTQSKFYDRLRDWRTLIVFSNYFRLRDADFTTAWPPRLTGGGTPQIDNTLLFYKDLPSTSSRVFQSPSYTREYYWKGGNNLFANPNAVTNIGIGVFLDINNLDIPSNISGVNSYQIGKYGLNASHSWFELGSITIPSNRDKLFDLLTRTKYSKIRLSINITYGSSGGDVVNAWLLLNNNQDDGKINITSGTGSTMFDEKKNIEINLLKKYDGSYVNTSNSGDVDNYFKDARNKPFYLQPSVTSLAFNVVRNDRRYYWTVRNRGPRGRYHNSSKNIYADFTGSVRLELRSVLTTTSTSSKIKIEGRIVENNVYYSLRLSSATELWDFLLVGLNKTDFNSIVLIESNQRYNSSLITTYINFSGINISIS